MRKWLQRLFLIFLIGGHAVVATALSSDSLLDKQINVLTNENTRITTQIAGIDSATYADVAALNKAMTLTQLQLASVQRELDPALDQPAVIARPVARQQFHLQHV